MTEAEDAAAYARAFARANGVPLIVSRELAARMRKIGVNVAELEEEGAIHVTRPIPVK